MKLLAWNLNHRAKHRAIPLWTSTEIARQHPDLVVLSEYVEGAGHEPFCASLRAGGLEHISCTPPTPGENQLLIASREAHRQDELMIPEIPSVRSNVLEVFTEASAITILGFRMPAFEKEQRPLKRPAWGWLLRQADRLRRGPAVIAGDFNTAPGDSKAQCGDCLDELVRCGWQHVRPSSGYSWRHVRGNQREIDHVFLTDSL